MAHMSTDRCEAISAHWDDFRAFFETSISANIWQIEPILVQNPFIIAPTRPRSILECIPEHIKNITKIDALMMLTSNFAFEISLMICEIWGFPFVEILLPVFASGFDKYELERSSDSIKQSSESFLIFFDLFWSFFNQNWRRSTDTYFRALYFSLNPTIALGDVRENWKLASSRGRFFPDIAKSDSRVWREV